MTANTTGGTPVVIHGVQGLLDRAGETLGVSDWVDVTQANVDTFAELSGDEQWIHVDPGAGRGGPVRRDRAARLLHAVAVDRPARPGLPRRRRLRRPQLRPQQGAVHRAAEGRLPDPHARHAGRGAAGRAAGSPSSTTSSTRWRASRNRAAWPTSSSATSISAHRPTIARRPTRPGELPLSGTPLVTGKRGALSGSGRAALLENGGPDGRGIAARDRFRRGRGRDQDQLPRGGRGRGGPDPRVGPRRDVVRELAPGHPGARQGLPRRGAGHGRASGSASGRRTCSTAWTRGPARPSP